LEFSRVRSPAWVLILKLTLKIINMKLIAEKNGFEIYFVCEKQEYVVYNDGKFLIGNKYKYSDVKCYID